MSEQSALTAQQLQERLREAPFHEWLGLEVVSVTDTALELTASWRPEWANSTGVAHGGILAALLDLAADWTLVATQGAPAPTIDFTVHYLRPAGPGDLTVRSQIVRAGRSLTVAEAEVVDAQGKSVAVGRGSYASFAIRPKD
ncbi:MAG TPA: PaaI family thioesterase [Candidatus Ruania gallistercoris]|uniref:PaaI family thioesterase n=1 Tax=Candidatus Ruania gallistercoris TaxID=2838746 RepID=A0A9D2J5D8_9MICO|nr:PaaI family thioesterase [Candidatus Ruania gallistercoris]